MEEATMPIDFDALVESGVLEKRRGWYKVNDLNQLPPHAKTQIRKSKSSSEGLLCPISALEQAIGENAGKILIKPGKM